MKKAVAIVILSLFCFLSCEKGTEPVEFKSSYFPNDVGNWWQYQVFDSLSQSSSFVTISIHSDTIMSSGDSAAVWKYASSTDTTTKYVVVSSNSVRFYTGIALETLESYYVIPLIVGDSWGLPVEGTSAYDTLMVVNQTAIELPVGRFESTFVIESERMTPCLHCSQYSTFWFTPKIGFVQFDYNVGVLGLATDLNETWQLVDFRRPIP